MELNQVTPKRMKNSLKMHIVDLVKHYRPQYVYMYGYTNLFHFAGAIASHHIYRNRQPNIRDILEEVDMLYEQFRADDSEEVYHAEQKKNMG